MRTLSIFYAAVSWGIVVLGSLHMLSTLRLLNSTPVFQLWFFGAGMAMAFVGALNLLHRAYGSSALGLRVVCSGANILLLCFAVVAGWLTSSSWLERAVIVALVGSATILSFLPSAWNGRFPTQPGEA